MRNYILLPALLLLTLSACTGDTVDKEATVVGTWEVYEGRRNNVRSDMLNTFTFAFGEDGAFDTNMLQNQTPGTYTIEGSSIVTEGVETPLTYEMRELTDSTLVLRTEYRGFQFDFDLRRQAQDRSIIQ